ncbi:MAG TPA: adenylate/guanylate cyclase domain-containing protein [Thermoanaerobaculia bacterium]
MNCPHCQFDNPAGMKFCGQCGSKLAPVCSQCGAELPPGFKFCGSCGAPLAAAPAPPASASAPSEPAPARAAPAAQSYTPPHLAESVLQSRSAFEGERKQVTVLFCDLVGSTALADRLGAETMHVLLNRFFELSLGEVHRYEGTINQFLGDGFMALFGAPIAHEDHARRAVLAALGVHKRLAERSADLGGSQGVELRIRMGINTGWVVVGGIGDHLRMDYTAVGDTTNLAARLQQHSEPGWILISETTSRMVAGEVRLEALPPFQVKGKTAPIQAFRVLGPGAQAAEPQADDASLSPFVGRRRELEVLEELRKQAASGEGQVVGLAGEAGSGKSRLLQELRRRSRDPSTTYLSGRCLSYGSGVPYLPFLYMLRHHWGISEGDGAPVIAAKVRASLAEAGLDPVEHLPYLLLLLGVREGTEALADLSPQALQTRTFSLVRQMILNAAQQRLAVLEIEDLHWADETSEELLAYLIEGMGAARILVLLTYRSGYLPRWLEKSYATQITMRRLSAQDSQAVVDSVLRRAKLPESLSQVILEKAEGNPFFLEELTRSLVERQSFADLAVPDTIQGVLMARIDRVPEEHKRLLQTASVLGRELPLDLLQAIWERPDTLGPLLADLKHWEFLYESPGAERPTCFFKHALTQEAVYQSLLTGKRQALHLAAGRALEALYADHLQDAYDNLVYHYPKAGEPDKAVTYLALFAGRAARGYAHAEAAKALREALVHAEHLPEARRDRRSVELILQLAESLLPLARFGETLELFRRYGEAVERLGEPALAGRYHFWLAHTHSYMGHQDEAALCAQRSIEEARRCGDEGTEGKACYVLSRDGFWSGQFREGIKYGLQAITLLERSEDRWWQGQAYWVAGFNHYALGRFEEALDAMARVHAIWRALADPRLDASWSTGYFYASLGDWERGIAECRGGLERAQDPLNTSAASGFLGYAYLEKGDLLQAIETLEDAVRRTRQAGMPQLLGWFSGFLAEASLRAGRVEEAREAAGEALEVTRGVSFWYGIALAERTMGRVARGSGDLDEAIRRFAAARSGFLSLQMPFEVARTGLDQAALAAARGARDEASQTLSEAHRTFAELRVPRYVERAERLAAEEALPLTPPAAVPRPAAASGGG